MTRQFLVPVAVPTPTDPTHAVPRSYVDALPSGGSSQLGAQRLTSGRWYHLQTSGSVSTLALLANTMYLLPLTPAVNCTLTGVAMEVTAAATNGTLRAGLYADDGTGRPGNRIGDYGTVPATTTGVKSAWTTTPDEALVGGSVYWAAFAAQPTSGSVTARATTGYNPMIGLTTLALGTVVHQAYAQSSVFGVLPSTAAITGIGTGPQITVRLS